MINGDVPQRLGRHCQVLLTNLGRAGLLVACVLGAPASFGGSSSITAQAPFQVVATGFEQPTGLAIHPQGFLVLTDQKTGVLYRLTPAVTAVGQTALASKVLFAGLDEPIGVAIEQAGHLLVSEAEKDRLVRFAKLSSNVFSAVPAPVVDGLKDSRWLAVDQEGNIFVSAEEVKDKKLPKGQPKPKEEVLLKVASDGTLTVVADRFKELRGLTIDAVGNLFAAAERRHVEASNKSKPQGTIFKILLPKGTVSPLIAAGFKEPQDLKFDALGALFFTAKEFRPAAADEEDEEERPETEAAASEERDHDDDNDEGSDEKPERPLKGVILKATFKDDGTVKTLTAFASGLGRPTGLAFDHEGNLYVTERKQGRVLRFEAPDPPVVGEPASPAFVRLRTVTVRGAAEPNALITILGGASPASGVADPVSGAFAIENVPLTENAKQTLSVFTTRPGGLTSAAKEVTVTHDDVRPDTMITEGPSGTITTSTATFTFSGTEGGSTFQCQLNRGGFASCTSPKSYTGLTSGSSYTFEVKAFDQAGNEDLTPDERTFTVSAVGIKITSPAAEATVSAGSLLVLGTVESAGAEVGVTVNGVPAAVHGTTFAALVPVDSNTTSLKAVATTTAGLPASHSVIIAVSGTSEDEIVLDASPRSGVAPLTVTFSLSGVVPPATIEFDFNGTSKRTIDFIGPSLEDQTFTYRQPGVYFPRASITDPSGTTRVLTTIVEVFEAVTFDTFFRLKWVGFKGALARSDIEGAVSFIVDGQKETYRGAFKNLSPDLPSVSAVLRDITPLSFDDGIAEYVTTIDRDGGTFLHFIYFMRDQDGLWKIAAM